MRRVPQLSFACAAFFAMCASARAQSTAFYYGPDLPSELLAVYDQVVVEPSHVTDLVRLARGHAALVAYLSVGEISDADTRAIDASWVLGENNAWSSRVLDLTQPGYRRFVRDRYEALWRAGYRRFFLDTLDSHALVLRDPQLRAAQQDGLVELIRELAQLHPEARLLLNRGFEVLPAVHNVVHGVVAESLFDGWDAAHSSYVPVPERDRAWLVDRLREVRERYRLPVTVIDYRPPYERDEARQTAHKIAALGFSPWVCGGQIADVGVGAFEIMPRRVLIVSEQRPPLQPGAARWLAPVLEYLGYVAEYVAPDALPSATLLGRYAGVVTVLSTSDLGDHYEAWLLQQIQSGLRVVIFGELGFGADSACARALGISPIAEAFPGESAPLPIVWSMRDPLIGFEAEPGQHALEGVPLSLRAATARHLEAQLASGETATAIATTTWGGLARSHVFALRGLHGQRAWVLDPFAFLSQALALPHMPVPDLTTESGGRVALFAIDVEGAGQHARMRGRPPVSDELLQLLASQPWPHALGVGERADAADFSALQKLLAAPGAYPDAIRPGSTTAHGSYASLTEIAPLFSGVEAHPVVAPIACDISYLEGSQESYAFKRVLRTFAFTDAPRRLRPIALHYHAYAASSPGGVDALAEIYASLAHTPLFVVRVSDYRERVRAFREQVIARDVFGSYYAFGGEALRTLRIPDELAELDFTNSRAVASDATLAQGRYITFAAEGMRRLSFQRAKPARPRLTRANGRIEYFRVHMEGRERVHIEFAANAVEPLVLRFAGLPPQAACRLSLQNKRLRVSSDPSGSAQLTLATTTTGAATLTCPGT